MLGGPAAKTCNFCQQTKPRDDEHFHRDVASDDGYRDTCKVCRKEQMLAEREATVDDAFRRLEERGIQQLQVIAEGGSRVPHAAEVYESIMAAFGGPLLFGQQMAACYFDPRTSQAVKAKLLTAILGLSRAVSDSGAIARDLDSFSTVDLQNLVQERYKNAVRELQLRVVPSAEPAAPALPAALIPGFQQEAHHARVG